MHGHVAPRSDFLYRFAVIFPMGEGIPHDVVAFRQLELIARKSLVRPQRLVSEPIDDVDGEGTVYGAVSFDTGTIFTIDDLHYEYGDVYDFEIPERDAAYCFGKRNYFFGFGAYG